jgi:hypothetical protein
MKIKHSITFLVFGYCLDFIGGLLKILHHQYSDLTLIVATILKVIGGLLLLYKLLNHPKLKDIFNS